MSTSKMSGNDDCDFEELAALLSSDDEDDIDEDELDKLVNLAEEDLNNTTSKTETTVNRSLNSRSLKTTGNSPESNDMYKDDSHRLKADVSSVAPHEPLVSTVGTSSLPESDNTDSMDIPSDPQKELMEMRKRLALLEAALLKQNTVSPPTTAEPVATKTTNETSQLTRPNVSSTSRISRYAKPAKKESQGVRPSQKLRVLEEDIFSPPDQVPSRKMASSSGRTSLLPAADDDDWEGLDGERTSGLSDAGQSMQVLLEKHSSFDYASPSGEPETIARSRSWQDRSKCKDSLDRKREQHGSGTGDPVMTEPFSGLRVIKPLVSSGQMKQKVAGRKMVKLSKLHTRVNTADLQGDWVTIGVIVNKSEPKMSSKGKQYSMWKLSDLDDCTKLVSFFLFGEVHRQHWKVTVGNVIGLLNANIMQNSEHYQSRDSSQMSFTIDHAQKLMLIGQSRDFGVCKSKTRAGNSCTNVINRLHGEHCTYHVQAAYKRLSAKRSEIQAGYSGVVPRSFEKRIFGRGSDAVTYQGQTFTTTAYTGATRKSVSIKHLQQHGAGSKNKQGQVTSLSLHQMQPDGHLAPKPQQPSAKVKDDAFLDLLTAPSVGAMNFVKHLMKKEKVDEASKSDKPIESVSAKDLLKAHKEDMKRKIAARKREQAMASPSGSTSGVKATSPLDVKPQLGRGLTPGSEFDLGDVSFSNNRRVTDRQKARVELAKQRAIARVKEKGGVEKLQSSGMTDKAEKRLLSSDDSPPTETRGQPPRKRSRLLGDIDLNSPEVQKLLKAGSSHASAVNEKDQARQDQYFDVLEQKEKMEEKMSTVREMKCRVVSCKQCKYTAFTATDMCKAAGHQVVSHNATKRFFACKDCKKPAVSFFKYPTQPCSKCAGNSFERTSMYKEKKGPATDKEDFEKHLRGDECKFINSMV